MSNEPAERDRTLPRISAAGLLAEVAFWQGAGFVALLLLVWSIEVLDLPMLLYGEPNARVDYIGASLVSAGLVICGFIVVGQTYLQQRRTLRGFVNLCARCKKAHVAGLEWEPVESLLVRHAPVRVSHSLCPGCFGDFVAAMVVKGHLTTEQADALVEGRGQAR
jgi:hypothetical protein